MLSYASASEPLRAANELSGKNLYEIWNIPATGARAKSSCGAIVPANAHVGERVGYDLVLVISGQDTRQAQERRLLDWLRQLARRKVVLGGLAAGPLMLVRAGLLRDRAFTLHDSHYDALVETRPELNVRKSLYWIDRDRVTSAGGRASMDLMHAVIGTAHGEFFAQQVSDWCSNPYVQDAGDPQTSGPVARYGTNNADVIKAVGLMEDHLSDPLDLGQLASMIDVSDRQLNRMSISDVMAATGFQSASHFSRSFKQYYSVTPTDLRASLGDLTV